MRETFRWVGAVLWLSAVGACGGGGEGGGGGGPGGFQAQVQGTWVACDGSAGSYVKTVTTMSGNGFSSTSTLHADDTCTGAGTPFSTDTGTFTVGATVDAALGSRRVTATQTDSTSTAAGRVFYSLVFVDTGVTPNRWYLGLKDAAHDGRSAATRPVALDDSLYFVRR